MSSSSIPVLLCGRSSAVGRIVAKGLLPEYEVVHFMTSPVAAKQDILTVLSGGQPPTEQPTDSDAAVGTANFACPPRAVLLGRAFDEQQTEEIRAACKERASEVAWVLADPAVPPPKGPPGPGYAEKVVDDVKQVLGAWRKAGEKAGAVLYW